MKIELDVFECRSHGWKLFIILVIVTGYSNMIVKTHLVQKNAPGVFVSIEGSVYCQYG